MVWSRGLNVSVVGAGLVVGSLCAFVAARFVEAPSLANRAALFERLAIEAERALGHGDRAGFREWGQTIVDASQAVEGIRLRAARGDVIEFLPAELGAAASAGLTLDLPSGGKLDFVLRASPWLPPAALVATLTAVAVLLTTVWTLRRRLYVPLEELSQRVATLGYAASVGPLDGACAELNEVALRLEAAAARSVERGASRDGASRDDASRYVRKATSGTSRRSRVSAVGAVSDGSAGSKVDEAERIKDEFLSSVSHELRTPLTSIRSFTELLKELAPADDPELWREFLQIIETETDRLTRLVEGLLDMSKVEAEDQSLDLAAHDVAVLIDDVLSAQAASLVMAKLEVEVFVDPTLPLAKVDGDALHQVFSNLVANACKFVPEGGTLRVSAREAEGAGAVLVVFEDSGPGVPSDKREVIFDKFTQGSRDLMTDKPDGTGLGLAICRGLLTRMGAEISCSGSSALGGARFKVTLQRAESSLRRAATTSRFERISRTLRVPVTSARSINGA